MGLCRPSLPSSTAAPRRVKVPGTPAQQVGSVPNGDREWSGRPVRTAVGRS
jgi:hypothetical protein